MDFSKALLLMKQGKAVRRKDWDDNVGYEYIYLYHCGNGNDCIHYDDDSPYFDSCYEEEITGDILADDWVEYCEESV